jgi:hypothetical protein
MGGGLFIARRFGRTVVFVQRGHVRVLFFGHDVRVYDITNEHVNQIPLRSSLHLFLLQTKTQFAHP